MVDLGNAFVTIKLKGLNKIQKHQEKLIKNAKMINKLFAESRTLLDKIDAVKLDPECEKLEFECEDKK